MQKIMTHLIRAIDILKVCLPVNWFQEVPKSPTAGAQCFLSIIKSYTDSPGPQV